MSADSVSDKEKLILELIRQYSFYFNPRDTERVIHLLLEDKEITPEKKVKILKSYKAGTDRDYYQSVKAFNKHFKIITKIEKFEVNEGFIKARLSNGTTVEIDPRDLANNEDDFANVIKGYVLLDVSFNDGKEEVTEAKSIEPENNMEIAKEIFQIADEEHIKGLILLKLLGYKYNNFVKEKWYYYLPRVFPLFKSPTSGRYINIIEISNRATGKTSLFTIYNEVFNYKYYSEMPSIANLVYDARNNMYGAVYTHSGIIFDEIQNWRDSSKLQDKLEINSTLSTGLENCLWTRGSGTNFQKAEILKCIPIIYSGNPINYQLNYDVEAYLKQYKIFTDALLDRIHLIQIAIKPTYDEIIDSYVAYPSILRAYVQLLQQNLDLNKFDKIIDCPIFSSRRAEQSIDIQYVLNLLDVDITGGNQEIDTICNQLKSFIRFIDFGARE